MRTRAAKLPGFPLAVRKRRADVTRLGVIAGYSGPVDHSTAAESDVQGQSPDTVDIHRALEWIITAIHLYIQPTTFHQCYLRTVLCSLYSAHGFRLLISYISV